VARIGFTTSEFRFATPRLSGCRERHRGAPYLGHRRAPPRTKSYLGWRITADLPTVFRGAHGYRSLFPSSTCGGGAPNGFAEFAPLDDRGAFVCRPSAARARASAEFPMAPHRSGPRSIVAPSPAALQPSGHVWREALNTTSRRSNRECLTLGIQELETRRCIPNTRPIGGMACESLAAAV
jgi:hypothetical protein